MTVYYDIEQGSDAWKAVRKGKPTASSFSKIITAAKGELSKQADDYINQLIGETFCPDWEEWQGNKFTERGKEYEAEALEAYATMLPNTHELIKVGFCVSSSGICGCSPDGLVILKETGAIIHGVEIKCPSPATHVKYVRGGVLPDDYKQQVEGSMVVTGLQQWDFYSYFPGMKPLHVVNRWNDYTFKVNNALSTFEAQYKEARAAALPKLQISL